MDFYLDIRTVSLTKDQFLRAQAQLKADLNQVRSQIDGLRAQGLGIVFDRAARFVNPYEDLGPKTAPRCGTREPSSTTAHPSTTTSHPSTTTSSRAFFKLYEILHRYRLLQAAVAARGQLQTLHLCEAPGSFVEATLDFVARHWSACPVKWYGVTLKTGLSWKAVPTASDHVIYADVIHDALPPHVQNSDLVTGDGGVEIEAQERNRQEQQHGPLLRAQVQQALWALRPQGHMVIKMFDLFEYETCEWLWYCYGQFDKVYLIKPFGSRICNSEKYVVGVRRKVVEPALADQPIPAWFYGRVWTINQHFVTSQKKALAEAIRLTQTQPNPHTWDARAKLNPTQECLRWLGLLE